MRNATVFSSKEAIAKSLSGMVTYAAAASVPMLAPLVASVADDVADGAMRYMGFDQPRDLRTAMPVTSGVKDFAASTGLSSASQLSRFPDSNPGVVFSSTVGDDMCLRDLAALESLLTTFSFNSTTAVNATIASWAVNPKLVLGPNTDLSIGNTIKATFGTPSNLAIVTAPFTRWRGTLSYSFRFCASAFHTARVRVFFVPGEDDGFILPGGPAVDYWNHLIEISGNTDVEIQVPFVFPLAYSQQSIGRLCVQVAVPPAAVGDVTPSSSPIDVLVAVKGMDDLEVVDPNGQYWLDFAYTGIREEPPIETVLQPESKLMPNASVVINGGPYTTARFSDLGQLLRGPELYCVETGDSNSGALINRVIVPPTYGYAPIGCNVSLSAGAPNDSVPVVLTNPSTHLPGTVVYANTTHQTVRPVSAVSTITQIYGFTALQAFSQYFWFWRGGIRYTAMPENTNVTNGVEQPLRLPFTLMSPLQGSASSDAIVASNQLPVTVSTLSVTPEQPADANCVVSTVEVPFMAPQLFSRNTTPSPATQACGALVVKSLGNLKYYACAADDFRFLLPRRLTWSTLVATRVAKTDPGNFNYTRPYIVYLWGPNVGTGSLPVPLNSNAVCLY